MSSNSAKIIVVSGVLLTLCQFCCVPGLAGNLTLTDRSPRPGQRNIPPATNVKAVFSRSLRPESVHLFSVHLSDGKRKIPGKVVYHPEECSIEYVPLRALPAHKEFTFTLENEVSSSDGESLPGRQEWKFSTGGVQPPVVRPQVEAKQVEVKPPDPPGPTPTVPLKRPVSRRMHLVSSLPPDGSLTAVAPEKIVFSFDRDLLFDSLTLFTVRLSDGIGNIVGAIKQGGSLREAVFIPETSLSSGMDYELVIAPGVFAADGSCLEEEVRVSFTVGKAGSAGAAAKEDTTDKPIPEDVAAQQSSGEPKRFRVQHTSGFNKSRNQMLSTPPGGVLDAGGGQSIDEDNMDEEQTSRLKRIRNLLGTLRSEEQ